ncbi:MAG TPA: 2'-5' RNA ligase family protein [Gemmatimonadaceae bacterium]|nr:2'-5' RNA ligase family protein [Gemmatimonadaceae bacterium]
MIANGIFMIAELGGAAGERIREINLKYDPRLARYKAPHVTITGSSGVGPLPASVTVAEMSEKLGPIAASTAPLSLRFAQPMRFMSTEIIVLPLDPHGPLRVFHDQVASSGLPFQQARFTFSPHCTLSLYPTLTREVERELLSVRITEPVIIDSVTMYQTLDPQPSKKLLELKLTGTH